MTFEPADDAARLRASVERRGIHSIYHYTAVANLPSIVRVGAILSRAEMDARGISYVGHSWGRPGKELQLEEYICCGLVAHWGMLRKETQPQAVLALSPELIWRRGTLFCLGNSASNEFDLDFLRDRNTAEAFDEMFTSPVTDFPTPYQCEILVYRQIPLDHLLTVHFQTEEVRTPGIALMRDALSALPGRRPSWLPIRHSVTPGLWPPAR